MKRFSLLSVVGAWLGLVLLSGCATTQIPPVPGTLAVQVSVPPSWNGFIDVENRVTEALVDQVRDVFQEAGFDKPVKEVRFFSEAERAPYLLTINLVEWRVNRAGFVECSFTADLKTPHAEKHLGMYTHHTMRGLGGPGRYGLALSFEEAAGGALRALRNDVARSELLPDLRPEAA